MSDCYSFFYWSIAGVEHFLLCTNSNSVVGMSLEGVPDVLAPVPSELLPTGIDFYAGIFIDCCYCRCVLNFMLCCCDLLSHRSNNYIFPRFDTSSPPSPTLLQVCKPFAFSHRRVCKGNHEIVFSKIISVTHNNCVLDKVNSYAPCTSMNEHIMQSKPFSEYRGKAKARCTV